MYGNRTINVVTNQKLICFHYYQRHGFTMIHNSWTWLLLRLVTPHLQHNTELLKAVSWRFGGFSALCIIYYQILIIIIIIKTGFAYQYIKYNSYVLFNNTQLTYLHRMTIEVLLLGLHQQDGSSVRRLIHRRFLNPILKPDILTRVNLNSAKRTSSPVMPRKQTTAQQLLSTLYSTLPLSLTTGMEMLCEVPFTSWTRGSLGRSACSRTEQIL